MPAVEGRSSDHADEGKDWTSQHGTQYPLSVTATETKFHPDELPDPDVVAATNHPYVAPPDVQVDSKHVTQSPLGEAPLVGRSTKK